MIAATYTQGGALAVGERPAPQITDEELLLRVEAAAICGTDLKMIQHGHRKLRDGQTIVLGHEFVGVIERVGRRVKGWAAGQRVGVAPNIGCGNCEMCGRGLANLCPDYSAFGIDRDGAQAEYVTIPAAAIAQGNVIPLNGTTPAAQACLAEPLSCAVSSVRAARVGLGDTVLIYGAGPMGLLNLLAAAAAGAGRLIIVDKSDGRLEVARRLGASDTINPDRMPVKTWIAEQTGGRGMDAVICAVPVAALQQEAVEILAPLGRACLFAGLPRGAAAVPLDTNAIHYKQLIVTGMTGGSTVDYRAALRLIESGRVNVADVISDVFALRDVRAAYDRVASGVGLKVVLTAEG